MPSRSSGARDAGLAEEIGEDRACSQEMAGVNAPAAVTGDPVAMLMMHGAQQCDREGESIMAQATALEISEEEAASYRSRFPIFEHTIYLNSCSLGPLSTEAMQALASYQEDWSRYGAPVWWNTWMPKLDEAKSRFAQLIGAEPREVTISHSISSALSSIASCFDYRDRRSVVCADLDFPTIAYQWLAKSRDGVSVRFASSPDRIQVPLSEYQKSMDGEVSLLATSHVFYATGAVQPVRDLAGLAHSHGAKIIVDGYHSVGVLPINVKELDVDFYVGGTLKWLLGGPGLTFIYVREELIPQLEPRIAGWFSSADQFAFDTLQLDRSTTADRLELGTPSVPTAYAGVAGMDMILEAGPERIWPRLQMLTERIIERADVKGYEIVSPRDASQRGGIVMLRLDRPRETVTELAERGFTVDYRPGLVRISPHFYNTLDDVDRVMDEIAAIQKD
ncbi:MAG: aminotransferase class V-fold PLP-dependent enzyme [Chloroflexota bacterium]